MDVNKLALMEVFVELNDQKWPSQWGGNPQGYGRPGGAKCSESWECPKIYRTLIICGLFQTLVAEVSTLDPFYEIWD
jgi:hypothetical protein